MRSLFALRLRRASNLVFFALIAYVMSATSIAQAQLTFTTGATTDSNWSTGTNWQGGIAPISNSTMTLTIGSIGTYTGTTLLNNDIANPFILNHMTFVRGTGGNFTIAGGDLQFNGAGANISHAVTGTVAGVITNTVLSNIILGDAAGLSLVVSGTNNNQLIIGGNISTNVTSGTTVLTLTGTSTAASNGIYGTITDGGFGGLVGVFKGGAGTFTLSGNNNFSGGLTVAGGVLNLAGSNSMSGGVTIGGGTLNLRNANALGVPGTLAEISTGSGALTGTLQFTTTAGTFTLNRTFSLGGTTGGLTLINNGTVTNTVTIQGTIAPTTNIGLAKVITLTGTNNSLTTFNEVQSIIGTTGDAVSLLKGGAGFWYLSGANLFSGAVSVQNGTLYYNSVSNDGTTASALGIGNTISLGVTTTSGVLSYLSNGAATISRTIRLDGTTGAGGISNTSSVITATLLVNGNIAVATGSKALVLGGINTGFNVLASTLTNGTGTLALLKVDAGTWQITGANAYTGGTTISAGTLVLDNFNALGTGLVSATTGTLIFNTGSGTLANNVNINGLVTFSGALGTTLTIDGVGTNLSITNATYNNLLGTQLTLADALTLSGNLTTSGVTAGSSLAFLGGISLTGGNRTITSQVAGGTFIGDIALSSVVDVTNLRVLTLVGTTPITISGVISNGPSSTSGGLAITSGTVTLVNTNIYSGGTSIAAGTVNIGTLGSFGTGLLTATTGTLIFNTGSGTLANNVNINGLVTFSGALGTTLTIDGVGTNLSITNATYNNLLGTQLTLADALTLSGNLTTSGVTAGSSLAFLGGISLTGGNRTITSQVAGGTFISDIALSSAVDVTNARVLTLVGTTPITISGVISNGPSSTNGSLAITSGTIILGNANTFSGGTTITAGTITIGNEGAFGTGAVNITAATLQPDASPKTLTNAINLGGNLTLAGDQTLTLAGTMSAGAARTITVNNSAGVVLSNIALAATPTAFALTISGSGGALIDLISQVSATNVAVRITNTSASGVVFAGNNTYAGTTTVSSGATLVLGNGGTTGNVSGPITMTTGTGGRIVFNHSDITVLGLAASATAIISGSGSVQISGGPAGGVQFNAANTYLGSTTIDVGTLRYGIANAVATANTFIINNTGTIDLNGFNAGMTTISNGAGGGGQIVNAGAASVLTITQGNFAGTISIGNSSFQKGNLAASVLTLNGVNSFSGTSTLAGGTLYAGSDGALGTATWYLNAGALGGTGGTRTIANNLFLGAASTVTFTTGSDLNLTGSLFAASAATTFTIANSGFTTTIGNFVLSPAAVVSATTTINFADNANTVFAGVLSTGATSTRAIVTFTGPVGGAGATVTLQSANTFTGIMTVGGNLTLSLAGNDRLASNITFTLMNNAVLALGGNQSITSFNGTANTLVTNSSGGALVLTVSIGNYSGIIQDGSGGLSVAKLSNTGTLTLANNNTYTGITTVGSGFLALGTGGTTGQVAGPIVLTGTGGIIWNRSNAVTFNNSITNTSGAGTGTGGVTFTGGGSFTLNGSNAWTGATLVGGNTTLTLAATTILGTGAITVTNGAGLNSGGTLHVLAGAQIGTGAIILGPGATLNFNGTQGIDNTQTSALTLTNASTLMGSGTFFAAQATAALGSDIVIGTAGTVSTLTLRSLVLNGGSLNFDLGATTDLLRVTVTGTAGALSTFNLNLLSGFSGAGTYTLISGLTTTFGGTGAIRFAGAGGYTKTLFADATSLQVILGLVTTQTWDGAVNGLWDVATTTNFSSSTYVQGNAVVFTDSTANPNVILSNGGSPLTPNSILVNNGATTYTFSGDPLDGVTGLDKQGTGLLVLLNDNTFTGGINISGGGTLQYGNGGATGGVTSTAAVMFDDNSNLVVNRSGIVTIGGNITGSGNLVQAGSGTLSLAGVNGYTGLTTISSGTLQTTGTGLLSAVSAYNITGGALNINGTVAQSIQNLVTIAAGGVLSINGSALTTSTLVVNGGSVNVNNAFTPTTLSLVSGVINIGTNATISTFTNLGGPGATAASQAVVNIAGGTTLTIAAGLTFDPSGNPLGAVINGPGVLTLATSGSRAIVVGDSTTAADDLTISAQLTSSSSFNKSGVGTLYLTNANLLTNVNNLGVGVLKIGNDQALGTSILNVSGTSTGSTAAILSADGSPRSLANSINLIGSLSIGGTQNLTLATMTVNGASRRVNFDTTNGAVTTIQTVYTAQSLTTAAFSFVAGGAGNVVINNIADIVGQTALGNFQMTASAGLTVTLANANTYGGATTIADGTLYIGNVGSLGTATSAVTLGIASAAVINSSVFNYGPLTFTRDFILLANTGVGSAVTLGGTTSDSSAFTGTMSLGRSLNLSAVTGGTVSFGNLVGAGGITKTGAGTVILHGVNTYSGTTSVVAGLLKIGSSSSLGAGTQLQVNAGATLDLNGNNLTVVSLTDAVGGSGLVTNSGAAATLTVGGGLFGGVLDGGANLSLMKNTAGTLILTGINTYSGGTTVAAGTLQFGNAGTSGSLVGDITNSGVVAFNRTDTFTFTNVISGTGAVTQTGSGTVIFNSAQLYTGITTIAAGTLQIGDGGATGSLLSTTVTISNGGVLAFNRTDSSGFASVIGGTGGVSINSGIVAYTADNTYLGITTIAPGATLQLGAGGTVGSLTGPVANFGSLVFNRSNALTYSGAVSGNGGVTIASGTVTLAGTSAYTGPTSVAAGSLLVTGTLGNSAVTIASGASLAGSGTVGGAVNILSGGTLAGTLTVGGAVSATGAISPGGEGTVGTLRLGSLILNGGTLNFDLNAAGAADKIIFAGAAPTFSTTSLLNFTNLGGLAPGSYQLFSGYASGLTTTDFSLLSSPLTFSDFNFVLQNNLNSLDLIVTSSTSLDLTWAATIDNNWDTTTANWTGSATVFANFSSNVLFDNSTATNNVVVAAGGVQPSNMAVSNDGSHNYVFTGGSIVASGTFAKSGVGTVTFVNDVSFLGGATVSAGTMQIGNGTGSGSFAGNIVNNSVVAFNRTGTLTYSGVISGTGAVSTTGGTLILTNNNTYSGITTIGGGTLRLGAGGTSGSIAGNIVSAGVLAFNRTDSINFGNTISGAGSVLVQTGSITYTGAQTYSGATTISAGTALTLSGAGGALVGNIVNGGSLNLLRPQTYTGVISGAGTVFIDAPLVTFTAGQTYTGVTSITAGSELVLGGSAGALTGSVTNSGTLTFNRTQTYAGIISGLGTVGINNGVVTFSVAQTYTGPTNIANGATLALAGGSGSLVGDVSNSGTLVFGRSQTYNGAISGAGLVNVASGTVTFGGTNSYTGATSITGANLIVTGTLGNTAVTVGSGGSLAGSGTLGNGGVTVLAGGTLGGALSIGGTVASAGTISPAGAGTIGNLSVASLILGGGSLNFDLFNATSDQILVAGGAFNVNDPVNFNFTNLGGLALGSYSLISGYSGVLSATDFARLSTPLTFSGFNLSLTHGVGSLNLVVSALSANNIVWTGASTGTWDTVSTNWTGDATIFSNGISSVTFNNTTTATNVAVAAGGVLPQNMTVDNDGSHNYQFTGGTITASGTLSKSGVGTLTFINDVSFAGQTTIAAGTLQIGDGSGSGSFVGNITNSSVVAFNRSGTLTYAGVIDGNGAISTTGGTLVLTGDNTYSGLTSLLSGTLQIGNGGATGSIAGDVVNDGLLVFSRTNSLVYGGVVSGSGAVSVESGILTLTNTQTYSGITSIASGATLVLGGSAGSLAGDVANGGTLTFGRSQNYNGSISGAGLVNIATGTVTFGGTSNYTGATSVSGGNLVVAGSLGNTAVTVDAGSSLGGSGLIGNGGVTIFGGGSLLGTLTVGGAVSSSGSIGPGAAGGVGTLTLASLILNGGTLNFDLTGATNDGIFLSGGSAPLINAAVNFNFNVLGGLVAGTHNLITGYGLNVLTGTSFGNLSMNTLSGLTFTLVNNPGSLDLIVVSTGTALAWSGGNGSWDLTSSNFNGGTTAYSNGDLVTFGNTGVASNITITSAGVLPGSVVVNNDSASPYTFTGGGIGGATSLIKDGAGSVTFSNVNTYGGPTSMLGGTFNIGSGGSISNIGGVYVSGGVMNVQTGGAITGTGQTFVSGAGLLNADGFVAGTVVVNSGGTLNGGGLGAANAGHVGAVVVNAGGRLSPGHSVGQLTLDGNGLPGNAPSLTLNSGAILEFEFNNATGAAGTGWDYIDLGTGVLNINANNLNPANQIVVHVDSWKFDNSGHGGDLNNFNAAAGTVGQIQEYFWKFIGVTDATKINITDTNGGSLSGRFLVIDDALNAGVFGTGNPFTRPVSSLGQGTFKILEGNFGGQGYGLYVYYSAIPEPSSLILAGLASLGAGWYGRRRLKKQQAESVATATVPAPNDEPPSVT